MGRHSASYIAAQHRPSTGLSAAGAAAYVGRVGFLAVALGIGAAVAGGTGIAAADGASENSGVGPAAPTADSSTDAGAAKGPHSAGTAGRKSPKPGLSAAPRMRLGNSRHVQIGEHRPAGGGPVSKADSPGRPLPKPASTKSTPADSPTAASVAHHTRVSGTAPVLSDHNAVRARLTSTADVVAASQTAPAVPSPVSAVAPRIVSALAGTTSVRGTGGTPSVPMPIVQAMLQVVHREIERFTLGANDIRPVTVNPVPAVAPGVPAPTDQVLTAYGDIGKWMLEPDGQISDYGGLPYGGRTVLEPVNVIIVDPTSTSATEAERKLNNVMFWSGFPAQPIHSTGFRGTIDDVTYGQQPAGLLLGYSDNFFLFPNNHGRIFGPDPVESSAGYVWSGSFSTEQFVIYDLLPRHAYVSSNLARSALAMRLIASGRATYGGMVALDNSYNTATTTTGDHDGYAVVIVLK